MARDRGKKKGGGSKDETSEPERSAKKIPVEMDPTSTEYKTLNRPMYSDHEIDHLSDILEEERPSPVRRDTVPLVPGTSPKSRIVADEGLVYLIAEEGFDASNAAFLKLRGQDRPALIFSRDSGQRLSKNLGLAQDQFTSFWLTETGAEGAIDPGDLERIPREMKIFMAAHESDTVIVLLQGLIYLTTHNDIRNVTKLISTIRDIVSMNRAILVASVDPETLDKRSYKIIEREFELVPQRAVLVRD